MQNRSGQHSLSTERTAAVRINVDSLPNIESARHGEDEGILTESDEGDLMLGEFSQYLRAQKSQETIQYAENTLPKKVSQSLLELGSTINPQDLQKLGLTSKLQTSSQVNLSNTLNNQHARTLKLKHNPPSMLEREENKSAQKQKVVKLNQIENLSIDENSERLLSQINSRQSPNRHVTEEQDYMISVKERDVRKSSLYRVEGWLPKKKDRIMRGELDLKNQVLADKRKTLLKFLKDKRTVSQLEEASLIHKIKEQSNMSSMEVDDLSPIHPKFQDGYPIGWQADSERPSAAIIFEEGSQLDQSDKNIIPSYKSPSSASANKLKTNMKQQPRFSERILRLPDQSIEEDNKTANFAESVASQDQQGHETPFRKIPGNVSQPMLSRRGSSHALNHNHLMTNQTFNIVIEKMPGMGESPRAGDRQDQEVGSQRVVRIQVHQDQPISNRYNMKSSSTVQSPGRQKDTIGQLREKSKRSMSKKMLHEEYLAHWQKFDKAYKQQLFELGEIELRREEQNKYSWFHGQAKMSYLALNQNSQKRLQNPYFKDKLSNEKMDNLIDKMKQHGVFE